MYNTRIVYMHADFSFLFQTQTQRNLSLSRADYDRIHQRMMQELPRVMEGRVAYFEHCLQAIIEAQVHTPTNMFTTECCIYV